MTLTSHAVVGAAIASAFNLGPGAALLTGFMSHFLLDRLPHWEYELPTSNFDEKSSPNKDIPFTKEAIWDWVKICLDLLLGPCLVLVFFLTNGQTMSLVSLLAGAFGGILPDGLQFIYMKWRHEPFRFFYRFHLLMHSPYRIKNTLWGPFSQAMILLLVLILGNWFFFI